METNISHGYQFKAGQFRNWGLGIGDWEAVA
jgi:hypothetical protein